MATLDSKQSRQQELSKIDPAKVYESSAETLFSLSRYFLSEASASDLVENVAHELFDSAAKAGYQRYANLFCLRTFYDALMKHGRAKVSKHLRRQSEGGVDCSPSLAQAFCLLLRDRFELSCFEIAAVVGISEGSVRTRLERARARMFSTLNLESSLRVAGPQHVCISARSLIEDWNGSSVTLGSISVPVSLAKIIGECSECERVLSQRLNSLKFFKDLPSHELPEKLKLYPVSPLFVKEGRKVLFNWSAAPWYIKALFEGLLATTLVLGVVLSIPRIKGLYEFWLERRLDLYSIAELAASLSGHADTTTSEHDAINAHQLTKDAPHSFAKAGVSHDGQEPSTAAPSISDRLAIKPETEFIGRDSEVASSDKIYRVLIKTDSPETIKEHVSRALTAVNSTSADEDNVMGADLPGGVMFDAFVPLKSYKQLVNELTKMGEAKVIITRAKERGMPGKARLKIWLQRI